MNEQREVRISIICGLVRETYNMLWSHIVTTNDFI